MSPIHSVIECSITRSAVVAQMVKHQAAISRTWVHIPVGLGLFYFLWFPSDITWNVGAAERQENDVQRSRSGHKIYYQDRDLL